MNTLLFTTLAGASAIFVKSKRNTFLSGICHTGLVIGSYVFCRAYGILPPGPQNSMLVLNFTVYLILRWVSSGFAFTLKPYISDSTLEVARHSNNPGGFMVGSLGVIGDFGLNLVKLGSYFFADTLSAIFVAGVYLLF